MIGCLQEITQLNRKEKRKYLKRLRRKLSRQKAAEEEKLEEESTRLGSATEELRQLEEQEANLAIKEKVQHDEQERLWLEREKKAMEDFQSQQEESRKLEEDGKLHSNEEDWRYVENDGPAEIIWQGNEIILRKRRVKVLAEAHPVSDGLKDGSLQTSNPLPPQIAAFAAYNKQPQTPDVTEQAPVFGTEQDKTNCPFHIKTGVCRFGVRCSRVHVYPDQSFTLLMRNMYTGPGLTLENDEGLEHSWAFLFDKDSQSSMEQAVQRRLPAPDEEIQETTVNTAYIYCHGQSQLFALHSEEEVAQHYEEFYEDVHSEFLPYGELVNFKVCKNGSSHLRGNVYVHYKTEAGAQAAYSAMNGRFYAGKQITCEFVGITRWRVALCGEFMKGHHRSCSHGSACNFLHCFRNPHGEYDWADWDSPAPRYWLENMAKLFGYRNDHDGDEGAHEETRSGTHLDTHGSKSRQRQHRSRYRSHYSPSDEFENTLRHREQRKHRSGGDLYYSDSDNPVKKYSRDRRYNSGTRNHHLSTSSKMVERSGRSGRNFGSYIYSSDDETHPKRHNPKQSYNTESCKMDEECTFITVRKHKKRNKCHSPSSNSSPYSSDREDSHHIEGLSDLEDQHYHHENGLKSRKTRCRRSSSEIVIHTDQILAESVIKGQVGTATDRCHGSRSKHHKRRHLRRLSKEESPRDSDRDREYVRSYYGNRPEK